MIAPALRRRFAVYVVLCIAALTTAVTVRLNSFVSAMTDASGYVSAGDLWQRGEVARSDPIALWATWPNVPAVTLPLAYRAGPIAGTEVPTYPPGYPLLVGAAMRVGGPLAGYGVAPLMAGVLVLCGFALARRIAGDVAGVMAAALVAANPITVLHAVYPMSDLPAAVCWLLALLMALGGTTSAATTAGLLASFGVLIRPNLITLAPVIAMTLLLGQATGPWRTWHWQWRAAGVFVATSTLGPLLLVWSQAAFYGDPFTSGYGRWQDLFGAANIPVNLAMYPRLFVEAHTLLPFAGLACLALVVTGRLSRAANVAVISGLALALANLVSYLPYTPFDHWPFLRFLMPAQVVLLALFAATLALAAHAVWSRARWLALAIPFVALAVVIVKGRPFTDYALHDWRAQTRIRLMGHYLAEALPANAALLSFAHSGALAYYTGREVVRADLIAPAMLDAVVDDLVRHGYAPAFVLDEELEVARFREWFAVSRFGRLDWPPRAIFSPVGAIWYLDAGDRERYRTGARWPTDLLR